MNEMSITLTGRAGCWGFTMRLDDTLLAERHHHCFTDPRKALEQALQDLSGIGFGLEDEATS